MFELAACLVLFGIVLMLDPKHSVLKATYSNRDKNKVKSTPLDASQFENTRAQENAGARRKYGTVILPREDDIEASIVNVDKKALALAEKHNQEEALIRARFYDEALDEELFQMTQRHEAELAKMLATNV